MKIPRIERSTFTFLTRLSQNNNRDWFSDHKTGYESAKLNIETFIDRLIEAMNVHDNLETPSSKKSLYRIYNDVRFSKDKTPYNPRFAGYLKRTKPYLRGGYYYWIKPGGSRIGCGFVYPNADDLKRIRADIDGNYREWNKLLKKKIIVSNFGALTGHKVNTAPRGYSKAHPAIELLRLKQFWFEREFSDREVLSPDFLFEVNKTYKAVRPFFDYMSDVLTTDSNGESIL
jgi:uncharacterized protein (TIGR02453 family)